MALLRAAVGSLVDACDEWPELADATQCRVWLSDRWTEPDLVDAIRQASTSLADRVDAICAGEVTGDRQIRRAATAVARYVLRATGRPTPFGLFAGVAPVSLGGSGSVRWGEDHRPLARVNTEWLADVVGRLESCPDVIERLDVVFSNLAVPRGGRLVMPHGPNRVSVRYTGAVALVRAAATEPVRFGVLTDTLTKTFAADRSAIDGMLGQLVQQGFLITSLRAPLTVTDPLAHVVDRLDEMEADALPSSAMLVRELRAVQAGVRHHNEETSTRAEQAHARAKLTRRMRRLSAVGRTPLAVDLRLDCDVRLPRHVADEMALAASALLRLTRHPTVDPAWREFHTAFCDRYGTGTLAPLLDVVDPDAGLGYPAGYRGSVLPPPIDVPSQRDERLLALAWQAAADGSGEITLGDEDIDALTGDGEFDRRRIIPHVELAGRIHARSVQALQAGDYTVVVFPARAGGTLTSRFTPIAGGAGLEQAYRSLPASTERAVTAQLSFAPAYPHAENVCRVPAYLPRVLPLSEHRGLNDGTALSLHDLAISATRDSLHLVTISDRRVVEPQVFHALALDKQPPPLARFLAQLPRAFSAGWHGFDWGPHADRLPWLPRVRYRRAVLSPGRWLLTSRDLPAGHASHVTWRHSLEGWRQLWNCPDVVDLREDDRTLRLALDELAHGVLLRAHLNRRGEATLTETPTAADFGWLDGHAHEVAVPLVTTRSATPSPLRGALPQVRNRTHGQPPGAPDATWLSAKVQTHPERQDEILAEHVPSLIDRLGDEPAYWFVRYRSSRETDHLRLRFRIADRSDRGGCVEVFGAWAQELQTAGTAGQLVFDTYYPEIGRYGHGTALDAAEDVFIADSQAVCAGLRRATATAVQPTALAVGSMVHIARHFLGSSAEATQWLAARPTRSAQIDRALADEAIRLAWRHALQGLAGSWSDEVDEAWRIRAEALAAYRLRLQADADLDGVLESLLHMHHNRAIGIDPDSERGCRHIARQAALGWLAQRGER